MPYCSTWHLICYCDIGDILSRLHCKPLVRYYCVEVYHERTTFGVCIIFREKGYIMDSAVVSLVGEKPLPGTMWAYIVLTIPVLLILYASVSLVLKYRSSTKRNASEEKVKHCKQYLKSKASVLAASLIIPALGFIGLHAGGLFGYTEQTYNIEGEVKSMEEVCELMDNLVCSQRFYYETQISEGNATHTFNIPKSKHEIKSSDAVGKNISVLCHYKKITGAPSRSVYDKIKMSECNDMEIDGKKV